MRKGFFILTALLALAVGIVVLTLPRSAAAQCGSSVSSCKNCHEVQGKDPVNAQGAWHTEHAFGDFCEFCHAGNVKATDQEAAHVGMISPLADVQGSCQSCHPNDYTRLGQKYADTLGKPLGASAPSPVASGTVANTGTGNAPCGPAAPTSGQLIDLNQIYAEPDPGTAVNFGNLILLALSGAMGLVLTGLVLYYDKPLPRVMAFARSLVATPLAPAVTPEGMQVNVPAPVMISPEFSALERALAASDPVTVRAVTQILSDRAHGPQVLKALSRMDLSALAALGERDQKALAALLTLAKEMDG